MAELGLALSGGGFRATLFHLGVARFLHDAGVLRDITDVASVSGGSILAAHLVLNWERYTGDAKSFDEAAAEVVKFVRFDVRNHVVRRIPFLYLLGFLSKLAPWRSRVRTANSVLERYYATQLFGDRCLWELPESPRLYILATNVSNGGLSVFNRDGLYIQQRPGLGPGEFEFVPGRLASIPKVVGASSAFPGFFPPVEISATDLGVREGQFPTEWFTDGGVYDNLGLRAFSWLGHQRKFDQILVSDAGKPFQVLTHAALGVIGQSVRATDILWDRVWQLERENFRSAPEFAFIPITDTVDPKDDPTALPLVVQSEVQSIRTDLDRFTPTEINALAMHGYEVARKVYRQRAGGTAASVPDGAPWAPLPDQETPRHSSAGPNSSTSPATRLARQLRRSSSRRVLTTIFDRRDWPSYVYVAVAALLFVYAPYQVYQLHRQAEALATVINAIERGDPDLHMVFGVINTDPTSHWVNDAIAEKPESTSVDVSSVEILTRNRIIDLRRLRLPGLLRSAGGGVYVRERVTAQLLDAERANKRITLRYAPFGVNEMRFRITSSPFPRTITRVRASAAGAGAGRDLYELAYDVGTASPAEPVVLEMEAFIPISALDPKRYEGDGRIVFETEFKTGLASVWVLFPESLPYRTYELVRYPADRSSPPEVMQPRFTIDHPYGSLIGWSVVNPRLDTIYESRWHR